MALRPALSSGSMNRMFSAMVLALALERFWSPWARIFLDQGNRPSSDKSSSVIATISISGFRSAGAAILALKSKVCISMEAVKSKIPVVVMSKKNSITLKPTSQSGMVFLILMGAFLSLQAHTYYRDLQPPPQLRPSHQRQPGDSCHSQRGTDADIRFPVDVQNIGLDNSRSSPEPRGAAARV